MKYIDADHLKVEIKKHIKEVKDVAGRFSPNMGFFDAKISGIYDVMALLDTLSEEPDKSLEEAAYKYSFDSRPSIYGQVDVIDAFKAGAEWQASQMPMPEDTVLFQKGVAEGRRLMMEDAVEGEVVKDISNKLAVTAKGINLDGFKFGQKVRIVVLKEEE